LTAAKSSLSDAQAKLSQDNESSNQLHKDLDAAKAQAADLQSQLDKSQANGASAQATAPVLGVMPVSTSFEKGFWSSAYTLHIKNTNSGPLNVTITINGSQSVQPISATIKAGDTYDVPKLAAGSNVAISSDGFAPVNLSAH
jgi:hypothetical protein